MTIATVEWLEADGLGGFASGTSTLMRTRRYHGLLLVATTPPTGRVMLVNGLEIWVDTPAGRFPLSAQRYAPGLTHPDGLRCLVGYERHPWPAWTFRLPDGTTVLQELFVPRRAARCVVAWRLDTPRGGVTLRVRPLLSGRDYHATHRENGAFRFEALVRGERVTWHPYEGLPPITAVTNGTYEQAPDWYRRFLYEEEQSRGLDCVEDLASPGVFSWDLSSPAVLMLTAGFEAPQPDEPAALAWARLRAAEASLRRDVPPLHRAGDACIVTRGAGRTIVAGYPWFTDWGRDTFIAVRGLCIARGRLEEACDILRAWAGSVSEGMLPNRFPDRGDAPEFNAVDASLWYVVAVGDLLDAYAAAGAQLSGAARADLQGAVDAILDGYARGTRYGIRLDADGLIACGEAGTQLTWMDAKVGDWVVTPRVGKPVEVAALWLNALAVARRWTDRWTPVARAARAAFDARFWNAAAGCLFDVVDVDHEAGRTDDALRPNQILAVGGLPRNLLARDRASRVVDVVERALLTPMGLRSLAPGSPGYASRYEGGPAERDARYHQGTVWPWLIGPFVEAWLRVHGASARRRREARERFLSPLLQVADRTGGHLPEIADADPPHTPRGCPAQAWSVAELLRLEAAVLAPRVRAGSRVSGAVTAA